MEHTKTTIRELIIEGQLATAAGIATQYAEHCGLSDIAHALTTLSARIQDHQEKWNTGLIAYEDYSLAHAQLTHGLIQWIDRLPDVPKPAGPRRKFLTEETFKKRLFYLLLLIKAVVLARLAYHAGTGGFMSDQFQGTATLLAPALAAYIAVILADYLRQQKAGPQPPRYISGPLVTFAYWLFPAYAIMLLLAIELKAKGSISFAGMNSWLALVESVLGGYIGQMVHSLFKERD
jgi:hypothetical protein